VGCSIGKNKVSEAAEMIVKEHNKYRLRARSLQRSMEEIREDIDRIMIQMLKIAMEIDDKLGHYYK